VLKGVIMDSEILSQQVIELVITCRDEELKGLKVSTIARRFNVHRSHLSRQFKSDKNITPCQFIQRERMARAARLLMDTVDLTVVKLSEKLGFCSAEYFREVFKRYFGVAPSKYRKSKNYCKENNWLANPSVK
jgi:AraC-like DNA-binding protein